jgi:glycosyltransferase involved in cell wall biosynthesis
VKISVVVPAFNEEKLLGSTLSAIKSAASPWQARGWSWELIVCDNNSSDRTAEIARAEGARVVFEPINQIARARNAGAAAASGDWIVFVDADSHPSPGLFADVADAIDTGRYIAGGATVTLDSPALSLRLFVGLWNLLSRARRWCAGSFIFCRASAFRQIGGFSPELFVSEEIDLSKRLHQLAKAERKRLVILHRHPLVTSARKLKLYGHWGHLRFLARLVIYRRQVLRTREQCHLWYDGRR